MDLPSQLWEGLDSVVSVYQMVNANLDNDQSDGEPYHLWGEPCYRERILDCDFSVSPRSFFQPNPAMAQRMVSYVRDLWISDPKPRRLVDLYCGLGLFSVLLSDLTDATLGIELVEEAISLAKINGRGKPIEFRCLDAESVTEEMWTPYNSLLIDPPRMGLHPKVIDAILASPFDEIISVSCNPSRGIEDIAKLRERYELRSVKLFDQFPQTQHVEMIARLRRI
jgi:tRNA/tmRNA/rRNA uracil-C5-methylase (TrmA/RlmC/RlmD family)